VRLRSSDFILVTAFSAATGGGYTFSYFEFSKPGLQISVFGLFFHSQTIQRITRFGDNFDGLDLGPTAVGLFRDEGTKSRS
jgi:hypothetical protein